MRARKVDTTQASIVDALRDAGCLVLVVNGAIDLLVCRGKQNYILECKGASLRWTQTQKRMVGEGWPITFVRTPADALRAVGLWSGKSW